MLFIDDGSTDDSWKVIEALLHCTTILLKEFVFKKLWKVSGPSSWIWRGKGKGSGLPWMQIYRMSPEEIPELYRMVTEEDDLVSGWKKVRHDPLSKTIQEYIMDLPAGCQVSSYTI